MRENIDKAWNLNTIQSRLNGIEGDEVTLRIPKGDLMAIVADILCWSNAVNYSKIMLAEAIQICDEGGNASGMPLETRLLGKISSVRYIIDDAPSYPNQTIKLLGMALETKGEKSADEIVIENLM